MILDRSSVHVEPEFSGEENSSAKTTYPESESDISMMAQQPRMSRMPNAHWQGQLDCPALTSDEAGFGLIFDAGSDISDQIVLDGVNSAFEPEGGLLDPEDWQIALDALTGEGAVDLA